MVKSGPLAGTRVAVDPHVACGQCEFCQAGHPNLCEDHYFAGQAPQDGAMREYMCWPESVLFPLPDNISDEAGALLEPLGVAIHTVDLGKLRVGNKCRRVWLWALLGLMVLQLARLSGAVEIFATDQTPPSFRHSRFGNGRNCRSSPLMIPPTSLPWTWPLKLQATKGAVDTAVETVKPGGQVVLCGIPADDKTSFTASTARRKGLSIKMVRRMKHVYPRAISLVSSGTINLAPYASHRFSLEEGAIAFKVAQAREGLKVMINP